MSAGFGSSAKSRRLTRRTKKSRAQATLNIVSLMDIFTILVFFLLVNSAAVETLPNPKAMTLPESIAEERAEEVPVLMIARDRIVIQFGNNVRDVMSTEAATKATTSILAPLKSAIFEEIRLVPIEGDPQRRMTRGEINVMADKDAPYALLKKVMSTCTDAQFASISLAVIHRPSDKGKTAP
ncbi:biopolymer transporter ExbD [Algiphilus sp. W345]|uniref:Biopolymer transporter ExbD n=1 Tax=Banduia mediterranea TaxID=3075609 RepID=A0ABU2WMH8_9GAMM|nr:biopolymer transporter ExbD [Algiphilus sp. W345]MDT0498267.1 biopolymer transporter ExbD [Algiphilus sp. W345]